MYVNHLRIKNFRRLRHAVVALDPEISIFVGANNSGKTSASEALEVFISASRERFAIYDFNVECWKDIDAFGESAADAVLPTISLDVWFHVDDVDLHRVIDLLPSVRWEGTSVGMRIEFGPSDAAQLRSRFVSARDTAQANARTSGEGTSEYHPGPRKLTEYLRDHLRKEYELRYYVLDPKQFKNDFTETEGYVPLELPSDGERSGSRLLQSILSVDVLRAQRHLSDTTGGGRAEDLSRRLSRFYDRNLEKLGEDHAAADALTISAALFDSHLEKVFASTLERLADLGYPGLSNPRLVIRSSLNPATVMSSGDAAKVHYAVGDRSSAQGEVTFPDKYNGLGFKNLIYMVIDLLDKHARWLDVEGPRPPVHLVFVEEPEAHLHAQLQQVFIRKVLELVSVADADATAYWSQIVVTTHSPHIVYERGFKSIRYFRRDGNAFGSRSDVLNLSEFYASFAEADHHERDFLERYLKLTHCDLFFADAAILVEGNVERLLMPLMIEKVAPGLASSYLTTLEIGGAFGHRFRSLIEFLGLTALVVTDIDSVRGGAQRPADDAAAHDHGEDDAEQSTTCMTDEPGAVTSNQTLAKWLPKNSSIADLLVASAEACTERRDAPGGFQVRVVYQRPVDVAWQGGTMSLAGRTLEETFALENLQWCQHADQKDIGLRLRGAAKLDSKSLARKLHLRITGSGFNKTDFALALMAKKPGDWTVPAYIRDGLHWLQDLIAPRAPIAAAPRAQAGSAKTAAEVEAAK